MLISMSKPCTLQLHEHGIFALLASFNAEGLLYIHSQAKFQAG